MRAMQREVIEARRETQGKIRGSVSLSADACRSGELSDGALPVTTYIKLDVASEFMTLADDVDLRGLIGKDKDPRAVLPLCAAR